MRTRLVIMAGALLTLGGCGKKAEPPAAEPTPSAPPASPSASVPASAPSPASSLSAIPPPKPLPTPTIERKPLDTAQLFSGVTYKHKLVAPKSQSTAAQERKNPLSYVAEITVTVERPRPSTTMEDFKANDPGLAELIGRIPGFAEGAVVSPAFGQLYLNKENWIRGKLARLDQLLSRHNYYDCDTILEFTAPGGRRVLFLKGDMDVNTDGSDGDRNVEVDDSSPFFQPQTSYRWKKTTTRENPFLDKTRTRLKELKDEFAIKGLSAERNRQIKDGIELMSRRIYDLQTWSFLVSTTDPAVVLPGFMLRREGDKEPSAQIGDYAVVIHAGRAYPAIVGDAGPSFKFGEGSLRLCRELNPKSSANARPVSDLNVAYLVFPGSADPAGPPDLNRWQARCGELMAELGVKDFELHKWEDLVRPWPTPTPEPTPEASPASSAPPDALAQEPPSGEEAAAPTAPTAPTAPAVQPAAAGTGADGETSGEPGPPGG